jgi:hypothetical protein
MRPDIHEKLRAGRIAADSEVGPLGGAFEIIGPNGYWLRIICSGEDGSGWEHVSVSTKRRTPNWREMAFVKDLFWKDDECVVQYHPPKSKHVNIHPYCLHLWRCVGEPFPMPPIFMV